MAYVPIINTIEFQDQLIDVLRLDLIHPEYGGNKFFKLKQNLHKAQSLNLPILTFGGAHSNHIYSTAALCKKKGIGSFGVIRGEEMMIEQSPTLQFALECGMKLHFISREKYKEKTEDDLIEELKALYGNLLLVPEGGNNNEGVQGCMEILTEELKLYEYVFCACGTAATFSGIKVASAAVRRINGWLFLNPKK